MRVVLQRVAKAAVTVGSEEVARIGRGLLLLVGVERGDGPPEVEAAVRKLTALRIFEDPGGKMNLAPAEIGAEFLVVSQFTLLASTDKGRRPSFERAAAPEIAAPLVALLAARLRTFGFGVAEGRFGERMQVELLNEGPVTLVLDFSPA